MAIAQLLRVMRARIKVIMLIFLVTMITSLVVSLVLTKKYSATTTVLVNATGNDAVLGTPNGGGGVNLTIQSLLSTQTSILTSQRVVDKVIDSLHLMDNPGLVGIAQPDLAKSELRSAITEALLKKLDIRSSREGSTISINYEGNDPEFTQRVVNGFADAYVQTTVELKTEPAAKFREWFEAQTRLQREALEKAQQRLAAAQQAAGVVYSDDDRNDVETARLNELSTQLVALQALASESRSRKAVVDGRGGADAPDVVQNPLIQTLKADLARSEARLDQLSARVGKAHPEYLAAEGEVRALRERVATETTRVAGSIASANAINVQREADLRAAIEAQRAKVLRLRATRDNLAVLAREVQSAQRALDLVTTRYNETNLESQTRQSNVSILTRAVTPTEPARPQPLLNTIIGGVLGLFVGVLAALTLESMQKPLRDSEDLLHAGGVPVLAVLPPASSKRPQRLIGSTGPTMGPPTLGPPPSLRLGN